MRLLASHDCLSLCRMYQLENHWMDSHEIYVAEFYSSSSYSNFGKQPKAIYMTHTSFCVLVVGESPVRLEVYANTWGIPVMTQSHSQTTAHAKIVGPRNCDVTRHSQKWSEAMPDGTVSHNYSGYSFTKWKFGANNIANSPEVLRYTSPTFSEVFVSRLFWEDELNTEPYVCICNVSSKPYGSPVSKTLWYKYIPGPVVSKCWQVGRLFLNSIYCSRVQA